jgi:TRAP-type C4-dicarboxylate transport system permease small subunit
MQGAVNKVEILARWLSIVAGINLTFMVSITVADVILRCFGRPILGTYFLVSLSSAMVIGLSLPSTSWNRNHIYVEFLISRFNKLYRNIFNIVTRCMGIGLFTIFGWNLILYGIDLKKSGEIAPVLHFPFHPIIYILGICCFIQSLVLLCDIVKIIGGSYE